MSEASPTTNEIPQPTAPEPPRVLGPFRRAVLRGLGVFLAPLLTVVIIVWVWQTLKSYILEPVTNVTREVLVWSMTDVLDDPPANAQFDPSKNALTWNDQEWVRLKNGKFIPADVERTVRLDPESHAVPSNEYDIYRRYVDLKYLRGWIIDPIILLVFLTLMYLVGSIFAADAARVMWNLIEYLVQRVPLVRSIYIPVKQVVGYLLDTNAPRFSRVVAVQYPCHGIWTMAFVTGEGLVDIERISGEPMLTILFPTCPVPVTGNTKVVARREVVDLNVTVEQAAQYVISYGVVISEDSVKQAKLITPLDKSQAIDAVVSPTTPPSTAGK
jgi:uncharacterized membrane protein